MLVESTGISEPVPVAATFTFVDQSGSTLSDLARLDTLVTVVDCHNFLALAQDGGSFGVTRMACRCINGCMRGMKT